MGQTSSQNSRSAAAQLGEAGEAFVAAWLEQQAWTIVARRWRCRSGELDLVVRSGDGHELAFVEVKTRSPGNWDHDGALAMTAAKQRKLMRAAAEFLVQHPALADLPWRFDVALVGRSGRLHPAGLNNQPIESIALGQPVWFQGQWLVLLDYWPGAIELNG